MKYFTGEMRPDAAPSGGTSKTGCATYAVIMRHKQQQQRGMWVSVGTVPVNRHYKFQPDWCEVPLWPTPPISHNWPELEATYPYCESNPSTVPYKLYSDRVGPPLWSPT